MKGLSTAMAIGAGAIKRDAHRLAEVALRNGALLDSLMGEPYLGFRPPLAGDLESLVSLHALRDDSITAAGTYAPRGTDGPRFEARYQTALHALLYSERKEADFLAKRAVLADLQLQVAAHNDVVRPIDNGPEALVYLSETCYRLREAVKARCERSRADVLASAEETPDITELIAACRANEYAFHATGEYFRNPNHQ